MKKRILLISPYAQGLKDPTAYPPLGLLYVAANLKPEFEPEVLIMENEEFDRHGYPYYGISVHSVSTYKAAKKLINDISRYNSHSTIFVGGSGASLFSRADKYIKMIGEGEAVLGEVDITDLDNIKFPARYLVDDKFIRHTGSVHHSEKPSTTIITTRGCCYNCSFCDHLTHGRKFRKRSVKNISNEIKGLILRYGIKHFRIIDDCVTLDRKWFVNLCFTLKDLDVTWTCLSRADLVDPLILRLMKNCGCQEVFFGFETGSQKLLNAMNKKTTVEINIKAVKDCQQAGLACCAYMMFGFPGEDEQTVDETMNFLDTAKPDKARISTFLPIPGTDVWEHPEKYDVKIKDNYQDFWYFDCPEFGLKYNYSAESKMEKLRDKMMNFFQARGYTENWAKEVANG